MSTTIAGGDAQNEARNDARNEARVRAGFWQKARTTLGKVPFTEDAVAAFYCATDSTTPLAARTVLFAALAYFVMPFDAIPDFLLGLGFTDDAAVLLAAFTAARVNITETHRGRARGWLNRVTPPAGPAASPAMD